MLLNPQGQVLESHYHKNEHWTPDKESRQSLFETTCRQRSPQERGTLLSEGVACKAYKGIFSKGERLGVEKHPSLHSHYPVLITF